MDRYKHSSFKGNSATVFPLTVPVQSLDKRGGQR